MPDGRADRLRRRLVRRDPRRQRVDHTGGLGDAAALPTPESRPVQIRCGGRRQADLQPARVAVESEGRTLPDDARPPVAELAGMSAQSYDDGLVQLDRAAITLRRYHFPS